MFTSIILSVFLCISWAQQLNDTYMNIDYPGISDECKKALNISVACPLFLGQRSYRLVSFRLVLVYSRLPSKVNVSRWCFLVKKTLLVAVSWTWIMSKSFARTVALLPSEMPGKLSMQPVILSQTLLFSALGGSQVCASLSFHPVFHYIYCVLI